MTGPLLPITFRESSHPPNAKRNDKNEGFVDLTKAMEDEDDSDEYTESLI